MLCAAPPSPPRSCSARPLDLAQESGPQSPASQMRTLELLLLCTLVLGGRSFRRPPPSPRELRAKWTRPRAREPRYSPSEREDLPEEFDDDFDDAAYYEEDYYPEDGYDGARGAGGVDFYDDDDTMQTIESAYLRGDRREDSFSRFLEGVYDALFFGGMRLRKEEYRGMDFSEIMENLQIEMSQNRREDYGPRSSRRDPRASAPRRRRGRPQPPAPRETIFDRIFVQNDAFEDVEDELELLVEEESAGRGAASNEARRRRPGTEPEPQVWTARWKNPVDAAIDEDGDALGDGRESGGAADGAGGDAGDLVVDVEDVSLRLSKGYRSRLEELDALLDDAEEELDELLEKRDGGEDLGPDGTPLAELIETVEKEVDALFEQREAVFQQIKAIEGGSEG